VLIGYLVYALIYSEKF
ncbi:TPA: potassium-transporting ATPase subunit F, partial [Staphylococcus pseudintermedius]|nr:potassium-transporting ATPase subunit F [Staphylococcus pseudintermedius]